MDRFSPNTRGALFMMISMAGFVLNDTLMKFVLVDLPFFEAIFLRGVFASLLMVLLCARLGGFRKPHEIVPRLAHPAVVWRTVGEAGGTLFFLTALTYMPIANVTAVLQILPLTIALGAAWFLGEPVGWRRYLAILAGLFGVMLILRPGTDQFDLYAIYALVAVGFITLRDLATRRIPNETPSILVSLLTAAVITLIGAIGMPFRPFVMPQFEHFVLIACAATILMVGYIFSILTMRHGEVGFVTPFRYSILIYALLLGLIVFGEVPDGMAMLGAAIVVGSGLFNFYRERRVARKAAISVASSAASARSH